MKLKHLKRKNKWKFFINLKSVKMNFKSASKFPYSPYHEKHFILKNTPKQPMSVLSYYSVVCYFVHFLSYSNSNNKKFFKCIKYCLQRHNPDSIQLASSILMIGKTIHATPPRLFYNYESCTNNDYPFWWLSIGCM